MGRKTTMNRITSPEKTALINKKNLRLKDDFLIYMKSLNRSPGTISGYDNDLLIVFTYIMDNLENKDFQRLSKRDIISIQNWLISNGNSSARIRRVKAAMSSLSNYCENILADDDPEFDGFRSIVRKIENPPLQTTREKTVLSDEDVDRLLSMLVEKKKYEVACFIALAAFGGRRKAEICRFRVDDFDDNKLMFGGSLYRSAPIKTKGRGGGKFIPCYTLARQFKPYLDLWLNERIKLGIESEWLFPMHSDYSKQVKPSTVDSWMVSVSRLFGENLYAHAFRHYYTTMLSNRGLPDNVIQEIQGWADVSLVSVYRDTTAEDTIGMYFNEDGIVAREKTRIDNL